MHQLLKKSVFLYGYKTRMQCLDSSVDKQPQRNNINEAITEALSASVIYYIIPEGCYPLKFLSCLYNSLQSLSFVFNPQNNC